MQLSGILYYLNKKTVSKTSTAIFHSHFLIGQLIPLTWSTPPEGRLRVFIKCTRCTHPSPRLYKKCTVAETDSPTSCLEGEQRTPARAPSGESLRKFSCQDSHLPSGEQYRQTEWAPRPGLGAIIFLIYFQGPIKEEKTFFFHEYPGKVIKYLS